MPKKKVAEGKKPKAGRGKKESKHEEKPDKESIAEMAKTNAAIWELRLKVTDQSLADSQQVCYKLGTQNLYLSNQLRHLEQNNLDLTSYWETRDAANQEKINTLEESLKSQEAHAREEQNKLIEDYTRQINEMKELFRKKSSDFDMIQDGMKKIQAFEEKKAQMEETLNDMRHSLDISNKAHRENLNIVECKLIKEKAHLKRKAEQQVALVMEVASKDAILQVDEAAQSAFKENVRLNEALKCHMKTADDLQKLTNSLAKEKASLELDKDMLEEQVKTNAAKMEAYKVKLRAKIISLEQSLKQKAEKLEQEEKEKDKILVGVQASLVELEKLQKVMAMREKELHHMKSLARTIVEQRTELERFFYDSMAHVKQEITVSREQYKKEALQAYQQKMREATTGKIKFPPIRTFHNYPHSTNSVYSDMEAAAVWTIQPGSKVKISDLTWEQKEQVLCHLFAKMNGQKESYRNAIQQLSLSTSTKEKSPVDGNTAGIREELFAATFITQAPKSDLQLNKNSLLGAHNN